MSDSPSSPSEVTANAVPTTPHPPSDSAPPPSSSSSTSLNVPSRTYNADSFYSSRPPAPVYRPNSSVPNFIRFLSSLVFLGGSVGALVAWFYKKIVIPRLILALQMKTKLFQFHETKYLQLWEGLKKFTESESCEKLGGKEAIEFSKRQNEAVTTSGLAQEGQDEEKQPLLEKSSDEDDLKEEAPTAPPAAPLLLVPLTTSLKSLHASFSLSSSTSKPNLSANPSNLVQPQGQLMRSFVTFNEFLESELHSISSTTSNPYRTYGSTTTVTASTTGTGGGERKALQEATQGFKAEIRSIKGALLNRRNFVRPEGVGA